MRIAIVTPLVSRVFGNRCAFVLARELARTHDVTLSVHSLSEPVADEVRRQIGGAQLDVLETVPARRDRMSRLLWWQLVRGPDRRLARRLRSLHRDSPWDAAIVFADEGHWLGEYLRSWPGAGRPVTAVCLLELLDHPFLLGYARPFAGLRALAMPALPAVHRVEAARLRAFDLRFGISGWSSTLLDYLYGIPSDGELAVYDDALFRPPSVQADGDGYIALPTASVDGGALGTVRWLADHGVRFLAYGPRPLDGIPHRGFVTDAQMVDLIGRARGTLFLFDYEALGLLPIESLACGTPVITEPRQGPYFEHRLNPQVRFATRREELLEACLQLQAHPRDPEAAAAAVESVRRYRPAAVAAALAEKVRSARRGGGPPAG